MSPAVQEGFQPILIPKAPTSVLLEDAVPMPSTLSLPQKMVWLREKLLMVWLVPPSLDSGCLSVVLTGSVALLSEQLESSFFSVSETGSYVSQTRQDIYPPSASRGPWNSQQTQQWSPVKGQWSTQEWVPRLSMAFLDPVGFPSSYQGIPSPTSVGLLEISP